MTEQAIYNLVTQHAFSLGIKNLAPHDLRRTFAKLAHKGGSRTGSIQLSLGHSSLQTTERYLGIEQDLTTAPCDVLGLRQSEIQREFSLGEPPSSRPLTTRWLQLEPESFHGEVSE